MSRLQDQTNEPRGTFVDDSGERSPEFAPDILWDLKDLGGQSFPNQLVDRPAEEVAVPDRVRDINTSRTFGQRLFGVGTVTVMSSD